MCAEGTLNNLYGCIADFLPTEGNSVFFFFYCHYKSIYRHLTETHPQDPVEVLLVHSQEVTVVVSQDNGGSTGGVIDKSELSKVVSFMESANNTLQNKAYRSVTD